LRFSIVHTEKTTHVNKAAAKEQQEQEQLSVFNKTKTKRCEHKNK